MLITRRKVGEALLIGDRIEVQVLEISQGRVKLGVTAPPDFWVERREWKIVEDENRSASGAAESSFVQNLLRKIACPQNEICPDDEIAEQDKESRTQWRSGL